MIVTGTTIQGAAAFIVRGEPQDNTKRVSYGTYISALNAWVFPAYYPFGLRVLRDLRVVYGVLILNADAQVHEQALQREGAAWTDPGVSSLPGLPPDFFPENFQPYSYQREGIARIRHWPRCWFQWDMGTGKTRTVVDGLRVLRHDGNFRRALIVGPPVVMAGWRREVLRSSRNTWKVVFWDGSDEAVEEAKTADVVLATYTRCQLEAQFEVSDPLVGTDVIHAPERSRLLLLDYDTIVVDESHVLGNPESKPTTAVFELASRAIRRIALTGTPGETPGKVYAQLKFLASWLMPYTWSKFQEHFYVFAKRGPRKVLVGYQNLNEINAVVDSVVTRMKKDDCLDLPEQVIVDVTFDLGRDQRARYNELVATMRASITPDGQYLQPAEERIAGETDPLFKVPHGAARVNKLLQLVSGFMYDKADTGVCDECPRMQHCVDKDIQPYTKQCIPFPKAIKPKAIRDVENPKLDTFEELLTTILQEDPTNKVLCWGCFGPELDDMERVAKAQGVKVVRLDGKTSGKIGAIEAAIQEDPECRVLVGVISAAVGINLQQANYTIVYSLPWKPLQYDQALERNNRPGQKRKMTVYRLLSSMKSGVVVDRFVEASFRFKRSVGTTMSDVIACASCDQLDVCYEKQTVPFGQGCKYAASVTKPIAKVEEV